MAKEFKKTAATEAQIEAARSNSIVAFEEPPVCELTISGTAWVAFSIDGKASKRASLVITFDNNPFQLFAMSLLKRRIDYQGNDIPAIGTFNLWMLKERQNWKTIADMEKALLTLKGRKIKAVPRTFYMMDKNGNVRAVTFYEWNFID